MFTHVYETQKKKKKKLKDCSLKLCMLAISIAVYTELKPPDDEQQACSKRVEAYYLNKLIENSASFCFVLYCYITMHGQQSIKSFSRLTSPRKYALFSSQEK